MKMDRKWWNFFGE